MEGESKGMSGTKSTTADEESESSASTPAAWNHRPACTHQSDHFQSSQWHYQSNYRQPNTNTHL